MTGRGDGDGPPRLCVRLLGDFEVRWGDRDVLRPALDSARAASLIGYLVLHRDVPQSRQRIAFLMWPDSTESQSRTNLRHVLHNLRRVAPEAEHYIRATHQTLQWRPDSGFWLDVAAFEHAIDRAERSGDLGERLENLRSAVSYYRGDLLAVCYDAWVDGERERLRRRFLDALRSLSVLLADHGETTAAIGYAEQLLRHDPLAEETYQLLMRLHDVQGNRARALRIYHACAATLERELGAEPSVGTRAAYEALLAADEVHMTSRVAGPPLVGRAAERAQLTEAWRAGAGGRPRLVLVTGEAGIGKTRLIEEFRDWAAHHGAVAVQAASYRAEGALAYGPVVTWLRSDALRDRLRRLPYPELSELARILPELLSEFPDLPHPEPLPEADQRHRLFDAVNRALSVSGPPLLLIADDLQWADPESVRFVHYLLRVNQQMRLLVAATARLEEVDDEHVLTELVTALNAAGLLLEIPLSRLSAEETGSLAERLSGRELDEPDRKRLYEETEGNPLFVVEAMRAGWSDGHRGLSSRVQAVIQSRLDQLSPSARDLAGLAATIGRDFAVEVLAAAGDLAPDALVPSLDELWRRRIIREHGNDGYDFTHEKLREVVYHALTPARRRQHHLRVARALERRLSDDPASVSAQLAMHYERAGAISEAVEWYLRAADAAQLLYAPSEALRLFDRALALLDTLPATVERSRRELAILTALAAPLAVTASFASPRLAAVQRRAVQIAKSLAIEVPAPLTRSLAVASLTHSDFGRARRLGAQLRAASARDGDNVLRVEAEYVLGIAEFWQGRFASARTHFELAVDRYQPTHRAIHLLQYGQDPRVVCQSRLANTLGFLGQAAAARSARDTALVWALETSQSSHATALVFAALLALELRDEEGLREYVGTLRAWCDNHEAKVIGLTSEAFNGYVQVLDGEADDGVARIRRILTDTSVVEPAPGARAVFSRILLAACAAVGDAEAGLTAVDQLLASNRVAVWHSEARRLRAEFLTALGAPPADVAAELDQALAVARRQRARLFELRSATSAVRLSGRDQLAPTHRLASLLAGWTEAMDLPDVIEATRALQDSPIKRSEERLRNAASATL